MALLSAIAGALALTLLAFCVQAMAAVCSGFLRRRPRKIPMVDLALALVVAGTESILSLERVAHWISLAAKPPMNKPFTSVYDRR